MAVVRRQSPRAGPGKGRRIVRGRGGEAKRRGRGRKAGWPFVTYVEDGSHLTHRQVTIVLPHLVFHLLLEVWVVELGLSLLGSVGRATEEATGEVEDR